MNRLHPKRIGVAAHLFSFGWSIRRVAKTLGIASETAHRIQKDFNLRVCLEKNPVYMNTGARKDRSISFKKIHGPSEAWFNRNHYCYDWKFERVAAPVC